MATKPNIVGLGHALESLRSKRGISWRTVAREAGVPPSTITRMRQGQSPSLNAFAALVGWAGYEGRAFSRRVVCAGPAPGDSRLSADDCAVLERTGWRWDSTVESWSRLT